MRRSTIDRIERDGRRHIVARPNEHGVEDPRALTPRERIVVELASLGCSNKWIAYELGPSTSTIATHLASALAKLGLRTRAELASTLASLKATASER